MLAIVAMSVWQGFGYNLLVFSAALDAVPEQLLDAARIDGAGPWTTFWRDQVPADLALALLRHDVDLITSFQCSSSRSS